MKKISAAELDSVEEKLIVTLDLLEVAKRYCENDCGESKALGPLYSLFDVMLKNQRELADNLDRILVK